MSCSQDLRENETKFRCVRTAVFFFFSQAGQGLVKTKRKCFTILT